MRFRTTFNAMARAWLGLGVLVLGACPQDPPVEGQLPVGSIELLAIDWMSAPAKLGAVAAVAEAGDDLALYTDAGVAVYSSGTSLGSDNSIHLWRAAAAVPALGFSGTWLLAIDGEGRLHRLRNRTSLDEVTSLYGLGEKRAQELSPLGGELVAFSIDGKLAIADGKNLRQYELPLRTLSGGNGRVATLGESEVLVFDAQSALVTHHALPGAFATAFTADGMLWAASAEALYRERDGSLSSVFTPEDGQPITALMTSGNSLWLGLGDRLAVVRNEQLLTGPAGTLPAGARLLGSPSGDVFTLSGGQLQRVGDPAGAGADLVYWQKQLFPVFERLCQGCHLAAGSAHVDLSGYSAWAARRAVISQRVLDRTPSPMPPVGSGTLTEAELYAVKTWAARRNP